MQKAGQRRGVGRGCATGGGGARKRRSKTSPLPILRSPV
jgi:hypothetical protein